MAVDYLAPNRAGFDYLETLQALGQNQARQQQMQAQRQQMDIQGYQFGQQRQRDAVRPGIQQLVQAGDYRGAQAAAVGSGDGALAQQIAKLGEGDRKTLAGQNEVLGRAAFALKKLPMEQRPAAFAAMVPRFKALGFHDNELSNYNDFSDQALDGHVALSQTIRDHLASDLTQTRIDDVGLDNARSDRLAENTVRNTDDVIGDRAARRGLTARGQNMADARGRYGIGVASSDRQRGQDLTHQDRVRGQDLRPAPRAGRSMAAPNNPASMIPGTLALPVTVTSPEQARMLPKGTYFKNPDGKVMVR